MSTQSQGLEQPAKQRTNTHNANSQAVSDDQELVNPDATMLGLSRGQQAILQMQRTQGNAAVQRMLRGRVGSVQRDGTQINGMINGTVSAIQQPSGMACWATVTTMMASSHDGATYTVASIPTVVGRAGRRFVDIFNADTGLSSQDKGPFLAAMGLHAEAAQTMTPDGIASFLNSVGPLWVTTDGGTLNSVHARVVLRISGDGTAAGTMLEIIDPADGANHLESYGAFSTRYENVGRLDAANQPNSPNPFRAQIVHW